MGWLGVVAVMDMVKAGVPLLVGLVVAYGGVVELIGWLRGRSRRRRTLAVVVGAVEPGATAPGTRARSPVFRFQTDDGRVVDAVSSAWTPLPPKAGKRIPVVYDPAEPQATAERVGVLRVKLALTPFVIGLGLGLVGFGCTLL